ncbi:MAG: hypothetical protein HON90_09880 [Halobacteriovoraceae bacterium]|nr:hypothetical protein [Halobacteriovoraceae bacterium]
MSIFSKDYKLAEDTVVFSGRISKINRIAKLMRIKIKFENAKFITKDNRIEIWNESFPERKCYGVIQGRSSDYLLVEIRQYNKCVKSIHFAVGSYLHMYSPDLENNMLIAKDLINILHRKRTALDVRLLRHKQDIDSYIEKVDVLNKRYENLRQKLEIEWQNELASLEEDKTTSYQSYTQTKAKLHDLQFKLQQYRIRDQNLIEDRWSLDPKLYYKK